jgi:hypothetical protein
VKIIKPGKLPQEKAQRLTCSNCKGVVEVTQSEAKTSCDPRDNWTGYYVTCPTRGCGRNIWLK